MTTSAMNERRSTTSGQPLRAPKTALLIAQRIVSTISDEQMQPGDILPSERAMVAEYQVGRATVREALRFLEMQGVVWIKPGYGGGPVLVAPSYRNLASTITLLLQLSNAPFRDVIEVRLVLDPAMAAHAASRIDRQRLKEIRGTIDRMEEHLDDLEVFHEENAKFHDLVSWSAGNYLFGYLIESLHWITKGTVKRSYPIERRRAVLKGHTAVYNAIRSRSPDRAFSSMRKHMAQWAREVEREVPHLLDAPPRWDEFPV